MSSLKIFPVCAAYVEITPLDRYYNESIRRILKWIHNNENSEELSRNQI